MERIHLLSCPDCKRQLDVTALAVGEEVQCVCDRVLLVGPPKAVRIRGLSCGRCGGAISQGDTTCRYCAAALSAEDRKETMLCPLCAARLPNDSRHCKSCGAQLRIAAVPAIPRSGRCPKCEGQLRVHLLPDAEVVECAGEDGCGGLWCSRETFERLQRATRKAALSGESDAPAKPKAVMLDAPADSAVRYVPCVTCGAVMHRRQFRHGSQAAGIVLDVCRDHGVWFDHQELEAALAFVRSQVRGRLGPDATADLPPGPPTRVPAGNKPSLAATRAPDRAHYGASVLEGLVGLVLEAIFG